MRFSKLAVAVTFGMAFASAGLPAIEAADVERDVKPSAEQTLMVWGGAMDVAWFDGPMGLLGLTVERTPNVKANSHRPQFDTLGLQQSAGLQIRVAGLDFVGFAGGQLQANGGYVLKATGGLFPHDIDLRNFTLRPRKDNPLQLDVVSADGKAWFYIDRMMYKIEGGSSPRMIVRAMDLRVSAEAAAAAGRPGIADYVVAALEMGSKIASDSVVLPSPKGSSKWPGTAAPNGGTYEADVFMQTFTGQWMLASGEDGPGGADGIVVYTPSSTLRNNRANGTSTVTIPSDPLGTSTAPWAADVVWNTKFTSPTAPYNNDQHPYLVWNLYRTNADGSIEQIGQSGVKHAFLTINVSCDENPGNGHILGRGCSDTYGTGNNNSTGDLGPRNEIIPATGQWGRCGSVYDKNCNNALDSGAPCVNSSDPSCSTLGFRMRVRESDLDPAINPGASFRFESWYVVREDISIYNTMASRPVSINWAAGHWQLTNGSPLLLGPAIDQWVSRTTSNPNESSSELAVGDGHARVAVKVVDLGNGTWRYDYAVMNFDFARAVTTGSEAANNLSVLRNHGFNSFSLNLPASAAVNSTKFSDADDNAANEWTAVREGNALVWRGPTDAGIASNGLNWGTLYRFSVVTDMAPTDGSVSLGVAESGSPAAFNVDALVPSSVIPPMFANGFEGVGVR
ncbi:MAG: hypothetical protein IT475_14595 [Aquimonas sp.]|jgi:hypothetical protein|nr:hypothetical protein [Xanthomonadales bacterium]MCC6506659.1 hypothetical protein [Aquimonas sp.]